MYHETETILEEYGYHRYEISNYAREGYESRPRSSLSSADCRPTLKRLIPSLLYMASFSLVAVPGFISIVISAPSSIRISCLLLQGKRSRQNTWRAFAARSVPMEIWQRLIGNVFLNASKIASVCPSVRIEGVPPPTKMLKRRSRASCSRSRSKRLSGARSSPGRR